MNEPRIYVPTGLGEGALRKGFPMSGMVSTTDQLDFLTILNYIELDESSIVLRTCPLSPRFRDDGNAGVKMELYLGSGEQLNIGPLDRSAIPDKDGISFRSHEETLVVAGDFNSDLMTMSIGWIASTFNPVETPESRERVRLHTVGYLGSYESLEPNEIEFSEGFDPGKILTVFSRRRSQS